MIWGPFFLPFLGGETSVAITWLFWSASKMAGLAPCRSTGRGEAWLATSEPTQRPSQCSNAFTTRTSLIILCSTTGRGRPTFIILKYFWKNSQSFRGVVDAATPSGTGAAAAVGCM